MSLTCPEVVGSVAAELILLKAETGARREDIGAGDLSVEEMMKHFTQNKHVPVHISSKILFSVSHRYIKNVIDFNQHQLTSAPWQSLSYHQSSS